MISQAQSPQTLLGRRLSQLAIAGVLLFLAQSQSAAESRLVFQSGFEGNTAIGTRNGRPAVVGKGSLPQSNWDQEFGGTGSHYYNAVFNYVSNKPYADWVTTDIRRMIGPHGNQTNVLYMGVHTEDTTHRSLTRNEIDMKPRHSTKQGYARFWMMLDEDLYEKWPTDANWILMSEWKEQKGPGFSSGTNWRMGIYIEKNTKDRNSKAYWRFQTQQYQPVKYVEHREANNSIEVPVGKWFRVEIFWKIHPTDGELEFTVDSRKVFSYRGRTQHRKDPQPLAFVSYLKNYRSKSWVSGNKKTYHIYDDIELWTDRPQASAINGSSQPTQRSTTPRGLTLQVVPQ